MFVNAKALLKSLLSNNSDNSSKFMVVDTMLHTLKHVVNSRIYPNEETLKSMVSALCKEGKLKQVLDRIREKRCSSMVIVNTCLMFRMFEEEKVEVRFVLMKRLLQKNMILNTICYTLVVYAKVKVDSLESALAVYQKNAYERRRWVDEASLLMEEMRNLGLEPYETFDHLITGYTRNGKLRESVMCCDEMMERGLIPSCSAFSETVEKIYEAGDVKEANALLTRLLDRGFLPMSLISPGQLAFSSLIKNLRQCGKMEEAYAEKYLTIMRTRSLDPSSCAYASLIAVCQLPSGPRGLTVSGQFALSLIPRRVPCITTAKLLTDLM
ncbi:Pentatricopeptide repeat [Dillenia turbinata]|uniref:Pentatricopeptide repeat n=1 Tax=Dillenia turbinata TaxID=194707 RepID=A0AAN8YSC9_9MAGN